MKKMIRLIAGTCAVLLALAPLSSLRPVSGFASEKSIPDRTLFETSFEGSDPLPKQSTSDNGYYNNVRAYAAQSGLRGEITHLVDLATVQGSDDFKPTENKSLLFDGNASTKFLTGMRPSAQNPAWVSFSFSSAVTVGVYSLTSANDESGRDPSAWRLLASDDGVNYTTVDSRSGQSFSSRGQLKEYQIANPAPHRYYKLEITANQGADKTQLADLRLGSGQNMNGEITHLVDLATVQGSDDFKPTENKSLLFDSNASTKFLTGMRPSAQNPAWVSFSFPSAVTVGVYSLTSANDLSERDPLAWRLLASDDGVNYITVDSRSGQSFSGRGQQNEYQIANPAPYRYYKLAITENHGADKTQIADLRLGTGQSFVVQESPMSSVVTFGPSDAYSLAGAFDGMASLAVYGEQIASTDTYCRNLLYSGLNIPVTAHTNLSYVHFPALANGSYDYEYTSMFMALDVKFTDGSYLSELSALDQNGFGMDPVSKGESDALYTKHWNYIETCLGDVAEGKTIDSLCVYFHKDQTTAATKFLAYFDDICIEDKTPVVYEHLSDYVNTLRGTNCITTYSRGLTTPFCTMPNGFNFFTPVTEVGSNQPYQYLNNTIYQFSISHVPSNWIGDYGTWQFMANTSVDIGNMTDSSIVAGNVGAAFDHANEIAKAHYYSVTFNEGTNASGVQVEMTPTVHGVYVRFTFPKDSENVNVIFDCVRADGSVTINEDGSFTAISSHTENRSSSASEMKISGQFDQTPAFIKKASNGKNAIVTFPAGTTEVTMKLATSFLTLSQAAHNLELEIPAGETFDSIFAKAQAAWDKMCGIIEIEGASYTQLVNFYSNIYRLYSYPNLYSENKGTNEEPEWVYASPYHRGKETAGKLYVNNGFWDTYRTAWVAYALFTPSLDGDLLNGLLTHYKDNEWIPRWVAPGGASSMLGTSSDIIFADAYVKGIEFDWETAYESMLHNASTVSNDTANGGREENNTAPFVGYVSNSTSYGFCWSMEDYISDYCIGVMSEKMGKESEAWYYYNRAKFYTTLFNPTHDFFMGKSASGAWTSGANYNPANWWGDYTETNGWTMAFAPVFDGNGLAALYGGKDKLAAKLDAYFDNSITAMKKVQVDAIHEMVEAREVRLGQYGHSNQPAHAVPYLYAYADQPYKTQALVRDILNRLYVGSEIGQGYSGDEDNGEMSGWYVLSALGFYPQNMGSGQYIIGSPLFDKATIHLENGKDLVIVAENNSAENMYIQSATLNGQAFNQCYIDHATLTAGGTIVFQMGDTPSDFGVDSDPMSLTPTVEKASLTTDLLKTGRGGVKLQDTEFDPSVSAIFCPSISDYKNLFDDNSATVTNLSKGSMVYWSSEDTTRLFAITLTGDMRASIGPKSFVLEASNDGVQWKQIAAEDNIEFNWASYVRPFAIPEENAGVYRYYRLSFPSGGRVGEIEFLGDVTREQPPEITDDDPVDDPTDGSAGDGGETPSDTPADPAKPDGNHTALIAGIAAAVLLGAGAVVAILLRKKQRSA